MSSFRDILCKMKNKSKFKELFDQIINETIGINGPYANYIINDEAMTPIIYNNVCICVSALNPDPFHVLKRLNRGSKTYNIDTIITIIKRYINKDPLLKNIFKDGHRKKYSCSIQSKEFNDIKVQVMFELNEARDIFSNGIENTKYFCFIHTILSDWMKENKNDVILITESINLEVD